MSWIFVAFFIASLMHMGEEYFLPGGFMDVMKRLNPRFAPYVTAPVAIIMNGLQLLLCAAAMLAGTNAIVISMSLAGLLLINGLMHLGACIRSKAYSPGVVTGTLLYIPLAAYAYYFFIGNGILFGTSILLTIGLGLLYQMLPISYLALASGTRSH